MKLIRNHILSRLFCVFLALHIFNVSVDMPDAQPGYVPEDLSINDQESVVELVLEKWLGFENAVEEYDEPGDESKTFEIIKGFKLCYASQPEITFSPAVDETIAFSLYRENLYFQYIREINPPPPKA